MRHPSTSLDRTDRLILDLLRDDARRTAASIGERASLSPGAVRRRIARLRGLGVITRYTVVVDHAKVEKSVEAYILLMFEGSANVKERLAEALEYPEVREASTIAGDPDAVVRVRVRDLDHLLDVVNLLRNLDQVTSSKTLVSLGRIRSAPAITPPAGEPD